MKSIFETVGQDGLNVNFSPLVPNLFSCISTPQSPASSSSSSLYGFSGPGALHILDHFIEDISNPIKRFRSFSMADHRLLDSTWSRVDESIIWSSSTDGMIQIWDLNSYLPIESDPLADFEPSPHPVKVLRGHHSGRDVNSIEWNSLTSNPDPHVLTASCDKSFNVWDATRAHLLESFAITNSSSNFSDIFSAISWSRLLHSTFVSASSDGNIRIWSLKDCTGNPVSQINSCSSQLLSVDCSPHDSNLIIASSSSGHVSLWDMRSTSVPVTVMTAHRKPVKCIKFHPHKRTVFGTVSCDFTTKIWDFDPGNQRNMTGPLVSCFKHHTDHVNGFDFNASIIDQVVDCGSDSLICLYNISSKKNGSNTIINSCDSVNRNNLTRSTSY